MMMTENQKANMREWIGALRSGEYHQAQGKLRDRNTFCCLGVACDIIGKKHPDTMTWSQQQEFRVLGEKPGYIHIFTIRPSDHFMHEHFGSGNMRLKIPPSMKLDMFTEDPANLNDTYKFTFDQIADCLEYTYLTW